MKNYTFKLDLEYFNHLDSKNPDLFHINKVLLQMLVFSNHRNKALINEENFGYLMLPALSVLVRNSKDEEFRPAMSQFHEFIGDNDSKGKIRPKLLYNLILPKELGILNEDLILSGNKITDKYQDEEEKPINLGNFTVTQTGIDIFEDDVLDEIMILSENGFEEIIDSDDEHFKDDENDYAEDFYPVFVLKLNNDSLKKLFSINSKIVNCYNKLKQK